MTKAFPYLIAVLVLLSASYACATTYECKPQQTYGWKNGVLRSTPANKLKEVLRFDDDTATLLSAATPAAGFSPTQFEIVQPMSPDNDLIAMSRIVINGQFIADEQLRIRSWDKTSGLIYSFTDGQTISAGHCEVQ